MRWWGMLVVVAQLAFACQQAGAPGDSDAGPQQIVTDASVDGGHPDGGDGGGIDGGFDAGVKHPNWPPARPGYLNPIPPENQKQGDASWNRGFARPDAAQLEAYADRVSAKAGESVNLMVRSNRPGCNGNWTLYRIGWYGGAGARALASGASPVNAQPSCPMDPATKLVRCRWSPTFSVRVPPDALSGLYVVRIVDDRDRYGVLIPLVVKDDRQADLLMESAVLTAQAYNQWGGSGLYYPPGGFAVQVSFDRPYDSGGGSGQMLFYEALMARFLERYGYDVTYTTNLDTARQGPTSLLNRGAYLLPGHNEYWAGEQRDAVDDAVAAGLPVFFFGANEGYWKVRLSDPGVDGNARVATCYKRKPETDPLYGSPQQTGRFRDDPINRSEEQLVGTMYESWMLFGQSWTVHDASHPMYQGTGIRDGDSIPELVGNEYDRTFALDTPSPVQIVARSPVVDAEGRPGIGETTVYTAPSGAFVFGAATIYWAKGLDGPTRDPRIERITANLLQLGLKLPVPAALQSVGAPAASSPDGAWASSVRTVASGMPGPTGVAQLPDGTFVVADSRAHRIWQIDGSRNVRPFAGDGNPTGDPRYDGVSALSSRFFGPTAVLSDAAGNVYVADTHNCVIRKIANDASRTVTTLAGGFMSEGFADGTGGAARFAYPMGMAFIDATHIAIADSANMAIRVLDVSTRLVTTLAVTHWGEDVGGPAATASFDWPTAVAVAPDGRVFFVSSYSGSLKVIATDVARTITTLVAGGHGFADGSGSLARLEPQGGLVWFNTGLVVADPGNQRLRWVSPGTTAASTTVKTWAGSGISGTADGLGSTATFQVPLGLTRGKDGNLYVVDGTAGTLRAVQP